MSAEEWMEQHNPEVIFMKMLVTFLNLQCTFQSLSTVPKRTWQIHEIPWCIVV